MDSTITPPQEPTRRVPLPDPTPAPAPGAAATPCANCGAPLAADQRYCLQCGERHGDPRLPVMTGRPEPAIAATVVTSSTPPGGSRLARASANTTLVAGVGTLLLALGVGVLIGRSGDTTQPAKSSGVQVVTVAGGVAGAAPAAGASSTAPGSTADAAAGGDAKDAKSAKGKAAKAKDASSADSANAPASGKAVPKKAGKVVTIGAKGHGKGYKNGKFTGDFFGQ